MASIFSKIIAGQIPSYKVAESDLFYAFLDINPLKKGHTLVVPKLEIDYIFDIEDVILAEIMLFAKKVAISIEKAIPCNRVAMTVIGLEVPHAHIHLIPLDEINDINFSKPKLSLDPIEFENISKAILMNFNQLA